MDVGGRQRARRIARVPVCGHQPGNSRERSQVFELNLLYVDAEAEMPFELKEQLNELERIKNAAFQKIGVRGGRFNVEALGKQGAEALNDGMFVGQMRSFLAVAARLSGRAFR